MHEEADAVVDRVDTVRSYVAPPRPNGHGHCTKMCGCCLQGRVFPFDKEQEKLCQPKMDVKRGLFGSAEYDRSMLLAHFWLWRASGPENPNAEMKVLLQSDLPCFHRLDIR